MNFRWNAHKYGHCILTIRILTIPYTHKYADKYKLTKESIILYSSTHQKPYRCFSYKNEQKYKMPKAQHSVRTNLTLIGACQN